MYKHAYKNTEDTKTLKSSRLLSDINRNNIHFDNTKKQIEKELENILCGQDAKQYYENKMQEQIKNWNINFSRQIDFESQK